ncbi:alpha-2 adrenergic receptor-like [Mercenaria mercenaria]|uniref:alpha-2 adrenergic receptor-like n=1 Tax=Mercenaria mercenaria TaxID=6596 RepID=UPI00234FACA7|nr:alpha-2 adrenergic receptor-like [Mercenaria mercenaria]
MSYNNTTYLEITTPESLKTFENLENAKNHSEWEPPPFDVSVPNILLAITLTLLDVITIFGNLLVLLSFVIEKRLLQPFNMFILNLAVTDFCVAITAMTFYTLDTLLGYWPFGKVMCGVWIYFDFAMTFASVFTLVTISVDRFWCVTWAIHYRMHNNKNKTAVIIGIIWLCVVAIWTPPFIGDRLKHSEPHSCIWEPSNNTEFVIFVAVIGHYIPCIVMVFCYIKVFMVMRRQSSIVAGIGGESAASTIRIHVQPMSSHNQGISSHTSHVYIGDSHNADNIHAMESSNGRYLTTSSKVGSQNSPPIRPPRQAENYVARTTQTRSSNRTNRTSHNQQREKRIFITLNLIFC